MATAQAEHRLAILGAGVMGGNIATMAIGRGIPVVLIDTSAAALEAAGPRIRQQLRHAQLLGALPADGTPGELVTAQSVTEIADATAVVEAVTELTDVKTKALAEASETVRPGTPLISNTSGIPIDELADSVARPGELVGAHFMNPTYLIKMVEVIRGPRTSEATMSSVAALLAAAGREPVVVADAPGFVTSRLLHPMINDAARVVAEGTASVEAVDRLMEGCLGHPTGPLRTADLIGIDNLVDALNALYERTGDERCRPSELLVEKVREGSLGRKSGRGFYDYGKAKP
ncbi:3-hydroxyacyl-CoA dehydrogenase family protein [Streptomyces sp. NPDC050658]|uniref:3-hydroxyacyl-CoA dehydrogenase family protein n=1 Tax=unclassified Streptomyces TaxID=2593676 RepID=UPI0034188D0D